MATGRCLATHPRSHAVPCGSTIRNRNAPVTTRPACHPPLGGQHTGPNPLDCGKLGCKHHLLVDQRGLPLVRSISGTQVHDSRMRIPLLEAAPSVSGLAGLPRKRLGNCTPTRPMLHVPIGPGYVAEAFTAHCPLRYRIVRPPWQMVLGRRTHPGFAPPFPPAACPL